MLTNHNHIILDDNRIAVVDGTSLKVRELVKDHLAYAWSPKEMQLHHPSLTLAQVYAALAYYYDHQADFDEQIKGGLAHFEELRSQSLDSPVRRKLRDLGKL